MNARLANKADLLALRMPDPLGGGRMHDRVLAAALFKERVGGEKLIEGWVEGPCAEGADLRGINTLMMDFYDDPAFIHDLFAFNVEMALAFAKAQVDAGADIIGVGDAAASLIGPQLYEEFVFPHEKKLVDGLHAMGTLVRLHICGNTSAILAGMGRLGCDIVDLDYMASLAEARHAMTPRQVLLGNMDPVSVLRNSPAAAVTDTLENCYRDAGPLYIVGAGCEVPRGTPLANVECLRDYARSH
jgi:MtaA/CmuA family methyltransferase